MKKNNLIKSVLLFSILGGGYFINQSIKKAKNEDDISALFPKKDAQYRNIETKTISPYSQFGDSSVVLTTEQERKGIWEIKNSNQKDVVNKLVFHSKTSILELFDKYGNSISKITLPSDSRSRFLSVDPLPTKNGQDSYSPYHYAFDNPVNFIDPDGRSGEPVFDKKKHTVTINSTYVFYGSQANKSVAQSATKEISAMYNGANATVKVGGQTYAVKFNIDYKVVSEADATKMADKNTSAAVNFIRVEKDQNILGRSFMGIGENNGHWLVSDKLGSSTTAAHEAGHGYGLLHPAGRGSVIDMRGQGQPGIMAPRGTIVDAQYQYNSSASAGAFGGTLNPALRQVTQSNITTMFSNNAGQPNIGNNLTNHIYDAQGNVIR